MIWKLPEHRAKSLSQGSSRRGMPPNGGGSTVVFSCFLFFSGQEVIESSGFAFLVSFFMFGLTFFFVYLLFIFFGAS